MAGVQNLQHNPNLSTFPFSGGVRTGNGMIDLMLSMLVGQNYMPNRSSGQDWSESFLEKQRGFDYLQLSRAQAGNNMLFNKLGISENPYASMAAGMMMGSPDSAMAQMVSPLLGGNPMAASMGMFAKLGGSQTMGSFGRTGAASAGEIEGAMQAVAQNFYTQQQYEGPRGVKQDINAAAKDYILKNAQSKQGRQNLQNMGINLRLSSKDFRTNANTGASTDDLTETALQNLQNMNFDVAAGSNTDFERNVRNQIANKSMTSNLLDDRLTKALQEQDKTVKEAAIENIVEDLKKIDKGVETQLKNDKGEPDVGKIRGYITGMRASNPIEDYYTQSEGFQKAGGRYTGFDFEKSRGFSIEDLTGAFTKSAEYRMGGNRRGYSVAAAASDFTANAGGALSAARSVFGDKSGSELVEDINRLVGRSGADLSAAGEGGGANEIESLLRRTQATAKVAGISIKSMLGIIDSAKQLAANNPRLTHMNEMATTEAALSAVQTSTQAGRLMSPEDFRKAGGTTGMTAATISEQQAFASSGLGMSMTAIAMAVKGTSGETELNRQIAAGEFTAKGLQQGGLTKIATAGGMSAQELNRLSQDPVLRQLGQEDKDVMKKVNEAGTTATTQSLLNQFQRHGLSEETIAAMYADARREGKSMDSVDAQLARKLYTPQQKQAFMQYRQAFHMRMLEAGMSGPEKQKIQDEVKEEAQASDALAREYDRRNAPVATQVLNAVMSGQTRFDQYDVGVAAQEFGNILAVDSTSSTELKKAAQAGGEALKLITGTVGTRDVGKNQKIAEALNTFTEGRKAQAQAAGQTDLAQKLTGNLDAGTLQLLAEKGAGFKGQNVGQLRTKLANLKGDPNADQESLKMLQAAESMGIFEDESGAAAKEFFGGSFGNVLSGVKKSVESQTANEYTDKRKNLAYKSLSGRLSSLAKGSDSTFQEVLNYIDPETGTKRYLDRSGSINAKQLLADFSGPGAGAGKGAFSTKEARDRYSKGIGLVLNSAQGTITDIEQKQRTASQVKPETQSYEELKTSIDRLITALGGEGGGISKGLTDIATAIQTKM